MSSEVIEYDGYEFFQSELIPYQWHCLELRMTIAKQASGTMPWCGWHIVPDDGVEFIKDASTGHVATFATIEELFSHVFQTNKT